MNNKKNRCTNLQLITFKQQVLDFGVNVRESADTRMLTRSARLDETFDGGGTVVLGQKSVFFSERPPENRKKRLFGKDFDYAIFTDEAYHRSSDRGAFAYVLVNAQGEVLRKRCYTIEHESSNRAELKAIIAALCLLPSEAKRVMVFSDSLYPLRTLSGIYGWHTNIDLFIAYERKVREKRKMSVLWCRVKGHNGNYWNELCDSLCNEAL